MGSVILQMNQITKLYPGIKALNNVQLEVMQGEIHALIGENGAGKSTLMNVLGGVLPHGSFTGEIVLDGEACRFHSIRDSEKKGIAFIHQELALSPYLSIGENIFMNHEITKFKGVVDWNEINRRAVEFMNIVGLSESPQLQVGALGVGKQQLVEIAKALSKEVKLLILDEPTAALTNEESEKLLELLLRLKQQGVTSILISHKISEVISVADTITILRDGQVIETFAVDENITEDRIIKGMVGREIVDRYPKRSTIPGDVCFEVRDLNAYHPQNDERKIVNHVNMTLRRGEIVGVAGLMGAGRTEIAMSIFGKSYGQKVTGEILINGKTVQIRNVNDAINNGIAYVTEDRKDCGLNLIDSVRANMTIVDLKNLSKHHVVNKKEEILRAEKFKQDLNIKVSSIEQVVGSLSGGNQQKVVLAKWIMTNAEILLLDEPTRGIDVGAKYEIYQIMNQLAAQGKAILLISSELPEVLSMSDRVYVVNQGEIAGELQKSEISQESVMKCIMNHMNRSVSYGKHSTAD